MKPIKCIIGKHEWEYGQYEKSSDKKCVNCGKRRKLKLKKSQSIGKSIEKMQKATKRDLGRLNNRWIIYSILFLIVGLIIGMALHK